MLSVLPEKLHDRAELRGPSTHRIVLSCDICKLRIPVLTSVSQWDLVARFGVSYHPLVVVILTVSPGLR